MKKLEELRKSSQKPRPQLASVHPPKKRFLFYSDVAHSWCIPFVGADRATVSWRIEKDNLWPQINNSPSIKPN